MTKGPVIGDWDRPLTSGWREATMKGASIEGVTGQLSETPANLQESLGLRVDVVAPVEKSSDAIPDQRTRAEFLALGRNAPMILRRRAHRPDCYAVGPGLSVLELGSVNAGSAPGNARNETKTGYTPVIRPPGLGSATSAEALDPCASSSGNGAT